MKQLFILIVIGVFAAYCYGVYHNYGTVATPHYQARTIDVMAMSHAAWRDDPTAAQKQLNILERKQYLPPVAGYKEHPALGLAPDKPLTEEDYELIISKAPALARALPVRDPSQIINVVNQNLRLRQPIDVGDQTLPLGTEINREVADQLAATDLPRIAVVGEGSPIGIEFGTMLMAVLIFAALVLALRIVLYDPLLKVMDERDLEVRTGVALIKQNRDEAKRLADERKEAFNQMRREHLANLSATQQEAMREGDVIMKEAKTEAHRIRDNAHHEFKQWSERTEPVLMAEVDDLADLMVTAVLEEKRGGAK